MLCALLCFVASLYIIVFILLPFGAALPGVDWHRKAPSGHTSPSVKRLLLLLSRHQQEDCTAACNRPASQHPRRLGRGTHHVMRWKVCQPSLNNTPAGSGEQPPGSARSPCTSLNRLYKQNPLHLHHNGQVGGPASHMKAWTQVHWHSCQVKLCVSCWLVPATILHRENSHA